MTTDKVHDAAKDYPELSSDSLLVQLAMARQQQWGVDSVQGYIEKMKSLHPVARSMFGQDELLLRLLLIQPPAAMLKLSAVSLVCVV